MNDTSSTHRLPGTAGAHFTEHARFDGLLFDMGDVLYDATVWRRWLFKLLRRIGLDIDYHRLFRIWDADFLESVHRGERPYGEGFTEFLASLGLSTAQIDEVHAASQLHKHDLESGARPFPGVRSTITRLSAAGTSLGVLSDSECTAIELERRLDRLGLGGRFPVIVSSIDLRRVKPDPVCYRTALSLMELPARQVAFIGHDVEELGGAKAVGMATIAFNRDPGASADFIIERFNELLRFVDTDRRLAAAG